MSDLFLTKEEVAILTGFKKARQQIDHLTSQGIRFFSNAQGKPIVPKSAIEGSKQSALEKPYTWTSNKIKEMHGPKAL